MASARWTRLAAVGLSVAAAGCGTVATAQRADRDCSDFPSQRAAQQWYDSHPGDPDHLDGDGNHIACDSLGRSTASRSAVSRPTASRKARVVRVVDGDTIKVTVNGHQETVRVIGIDTPES